MQINSLGRSSDFVNSDADRLRAVIMQTPGSERRHVVPRFGFISSLGFSSILLGEETESQHLGFKNILKKRGVQIIDINDLINNAIFNLKEGGILGEWIENNFPLMAAILKESGEITANDLVGASDRAFYRFNKYGTHNPFAKPLLGMFFVRDLGVVLPKGVILASFGNKRAPESKIARLIFSHACPLSKIPVVFDAEKEGVLVQGGDLIVYDENTLLMGIDNLSSREAASLIAKKLNKTVVGVKLTSYNSFVTGAGGSFASLFLHLDTCFNLIDKNKSLVVPYFFEKKYASNNPLLSVMRGAMPSSSARTDRLGLERALRQLIFETNLKNIGSELIKLGEVIEFVSGTGEQIETDMKLVDYLREELGHKIVYVGGEPPSSFIDQVKHLVEIVIPEVYYQAANVFAISPGEVAIYRGNTGETQKSLRRSGVKVVEFEGSELARWNGGPHCMTLPVIRGGN